MNPIKFYRKANKYSQLELANKIGVGQPLISMWENGVISPPTKKLIQLAYLFNCSVDELLGLSETKELKNA